MLFNWIFFVLIISIEIQNNLQYMISFSQFFYGMIISTTLFKLYAILKKNPKTSIKKQKNANESPKFSILFFVFLIVK